MNKETVIESIINGLGERKEKFLNEVQRSINSKISNSSISDCLSVTVRHSSSNTNWYPSEILDGYLPRFIAFIRKKDYNGCVVDSYMTDKVVEIVISKFNEFYTNNSDLIARPLLDLLLTNRTIATALSNHIIEATNGTLPSAIKSKLSTLLIHKLDSALGGGIIDSASHAVSGLTTKAVAAIAAIPISKSLMVVLMKHFAFLMKGVIAKVLASAAIKTMLATTVKKIVAVKIIGAAITLFASKVGLTTSGAVVGWIVAPLIIAFLAHEVISLPRKMGEKVASEVRAELSGHFTKINRNVVTAIVESILLSGIQAFAKEVAADPQMKDLINNLVKENY